MTDEKKQQNNSNKKAQPPVKSGSEDGENGSKAPKTRMIYRHHRKFMGGGLVGLIIFAFLVGTETLPLYKQQASGAASQGQQTAIKVLERQHKKANTDTSNGQNTQKSTQKSVVARNGNAHQAQIKIHEDVLKPQGDKLNKPHQEQGNNARDNSIDGPLNPLRQQVKNLHKITHGQQQMIRMLTQKQNENKEELTEKLSNLNLQLSKTVKAEKPALQQMYKSLTSLQLRQDVLFFYNQWQEGQLTADTLRQWENFVAKKGLNKVSGFTSALRQSLEKYGLLNRQALRQTAREMHTRILADQGASKKPKTQITQAEQEQIDQQQTKNGWWQKLKDRLSGLVRIKRLENETNTPQAKANGQEQGRKYSNRKNTNLRENVLKALAQGDMKSFRGVVQKNQNNQENNNIQDPVVKKLRVLVNVHMVQKDIFQQLYRTLTAVQKSGE